MFSGDEGGWRKEGKKEERGGSRPAGPYLDFTNVQKTLTNFRLPDASQKRRKKKEKEGKKEFNLGPPICFVTHFVSKRAG